MAWPRPWPPRPLLLPVLLLFAQLASSSAAGGQDDTLEEEGLVNGTVGPTKDGFLSEGDLWWDAFLINFRYAIEGVAVSVIAVVGIAGNLLSMYILVNKKLDVHPFLCRLLVTLVVFDTAFLMAEVLLFSLPQLNEHYYDQVYPVVAPKFLIPASQIALTGSVYSIVAVTVERYISCCYPHIPPRDKPSTSVVCILGIVVFSVMFNLTRFFEYFTEHRTDYRVGPADNSSNATVVLYEVIEKYMDSTALRNDPLYKTYYLLAANGSVMVLIPVLSLVVLNWRIHKAIKSREAFRATLQQQSAASNRQASMAPSSAMAHHSSNNHENHSGNCRHNNNGNAGGNVADADQHRERKEREVTIGQILVAIVVIFCICQSFKVVVVGYEVLSYLRGWEGFPVGIEIIINLNHVALAINAAVNIAIYICKDKKFREACFELFQCGGVAGLGGGGGRGRRRTSSVTSGSPGARGCGERPPASDVYMARLPTATPGRFIRGPLTPRRDVTIVRCEVEMRPPASSRRRAGEAPEEGAENQQPLLAPPRKPADVLPPQGDPRTSLIEVTSPV